MLFVLFLADVGDGAGEEVTEVLRDLVDQAQIDVAVEQHLHKLVREARRIFV